MVAIKVIWKQRKHKKMMIGIPGILQVQDLRALEKYQESKGKVKHSSTLLSVFSVPCVNVCPTEVKLMLC